MRQAATSQKRIAVDDLVERLVTHPVYQEIGDEETLRRFMRAHVFCVWDFQSLLKTLQRALTCIDVPWRPTSDPQARRLINEIVLDEESDHDPDGGYRSHFELYLDAMRDSGADRGPIEGLLEDLRQGRSVDQALTRPELPPGVADFVGGTFRLIDGGSTHRIAAAFTFGRENVIPEMFQQLVGRLTSASPQRWARFRYYLERHIECDAERHGPWTHAMVRRLCGDDSLRWAEAEETARASLQARIALWDAIRADLTA